MVNDRPCQRKPRFRQPTQTSVFGAFHRRKAAKPVARHCQKLPESQHSPSVNLNRAPAGPALPGWPLPCTTAPKHMRLPAGSFHRGAEVPAPQGAERKRVQNETEEHAEGVRALGGAGPQGCAAGSQRHRSRRHRRRAAGHLHPGRGADGIWRYRVAGTRLLAYADRDLRGEAYTAWWRPEDRADMARLLATTAEDKTPVVGGVRAVAVRGERHELEPHPPASAPRRHGRDAHARRPVPGPETTRLYDVRLDNLAAVASLRCIADVARETQVFGRKPGTSTRWSKDATG